VLSARKRPSLTLSVTDLAGEKVLANSSILTHNIHRTSHPCANSILLNYPHFASTDKHVRTANLSLTSELACVFETHDRVAVLFPRIGVSATSQVTIIARVAPLLCMFLWISGLQNFSF
jgi:hypothetical protein